MSCMQWPRGFSRWFTPLACGEGCGLPGHAVGPEELGNQLGHYRKERKRSVVRAVPCVASFSEVDHHSLTPRGGYASSGSRRIT